MNTKRPARRRSWKRFGKAALTFVTTCALVMSLLPTSALAELGADSSSTASSSEIAETTDESTSSVDAIEQDGATSTGSDASSDNQASSSDSGSAGESPAVKTANDGSSSAKKGTNATNKDTQEKNGDAKFIGVKDNDNDEADVRDVDNGGSDDLDVTVDNGSNPIARTSRLLSPLRSSDSANTTDVTSGDGSSIDSLNVFWLTKDTTDNGDKSLLYLYPSGNNKQTVTAQIDFSMSGEHDYAAGDIRLKIPAHIFKTRDGKWYGNLVLPLAEAPSTKTDFNWSYIDDGDGGYYILTNTRKMSAATQVSIQLAYENIVPSEIVDNVETSDLSASIELTTHEGNALTRTADPITAQIDTHETVTSANKRYRTYSTMTADEMAANGWDIPDGMTSDDGKYVVVKWYTYAYHEGNTSYKMDYEDTPTDGYKSFIVENGSGTEHKSGWASNGITSYEYVKVAYPRSQFEVDTTYKLTNDATWTCTETDNQSQTSKTASASMNFVYHNPKEVYPQGHFYHEKWGDDNDTAITSHHDSYSYPKYGTDGGTGWYGSYSNALNKLKKGKSVETSYEQYMRGFVLPWIMQDGITNETADAPEDFGARNVTMTITDGTLTYADTFGAAGSELMAGEDFTFSSLHLVKPTIYKAVAYDGSDLDPNKQVYYDNGQLVWTGGGSQAYGGTYGVGYIVDDDCAHIPKFKVIAYDAEDKAIFTQTVDWTDGAKTQDIDLPDGTDHYEVSVTFGKADSNGDYVAAIADAFVIPKITLKPTDKVLSVVQSAFDNQTDPVTYLTNADSMTATYEDGTSIFSMDATGGDRLRGYSEDIAVVPSKSVDTDIDNYNQVANLTYTAKVEERSNISNSDVWRTAVADGDIASDTSCTWYDLLPKGVVPDLSSITLRDGDTVSDAYTIPNYKGSGRTLLVVKANLTPTPVSYSAGGSIYYYEDVPTITFKATYSFESMRFYGNDIHNVIAYESGNDSLGNVENYSGEPDNPAAETHNNTVTGLDSTFPNTEAGALEKTVMTDLDPNADNPNFVYAGASTTASGLSATTAELAKRVMVNNDGNWGSGVAETDSNGDKTAYIGGTYSYRLQATAASKTQLSDIILYDAIELHKPTSDKADYGDTQWQGQLLSVDVSDMRAAGIDAKVYYYIGDEIDDSTDIALDGDDSQRSSVAATLTAENGWVTTMPEDTSKVKAIAVDASKNIDGTDFVLEPGETTAAYVNMLAPRGDEALQYVAPSEGGTDADTDGSHAYNNGYLWGTTTDSESGQATATKLIRMDYTKVGLGLYSVSATKQWDDANDQDGVRPDSVTVHLYRDGVDTGKSITLDGTADAKPSGMNAGYESASWMATFKGLPYCDTQGNVYHYSIVEVNVPDGYTQSVKYASDGSRTLVNTHTPETVSVSGKKKWVGDTSDVRPGSITVTLYRDGESYQTKTVTADEQGNWSYGFDDLPRYHDQGQAYTYTVGESVEGYVTKIDTSADKTSGDVTADITNTYHPYGNLAISKTVTGATKQCAGKKFPFTIRLTGVDGGDFADQVAYVVTKTSDGTQVSTGTFTNGQTLQIEDGQTLTLKDIPKGVTYTVIESAEAGYTASSDTLSGTIASNNTSKADFTNAYETEGSVSLSATKKLKGTNLEGNQFRFELRDEGEKDADGNVVSAATNRLVRDTTNGADGAVTFGALHYEAVDSGHTFTYKISETDGGAKGYTYSDAVYYAQVTPVDNGDGTMTCTVKYFSDADCTDEIAPSKCTFANSYKAEGSISLTAYKKLSSGTLEDGQFTFQLYDADGNVLYLDENGHTTTTETDTPLTATNDASGTVAFPQISYTQDDLADTDDSGTVTGYSDKTFTYTAKETIPDDAVAVNADYDMVDASGTVVTSSDSALTYADATNDQKAQYSFAKNGYVYSEESRSWNVTVQDDGDGTLSTTVENVTVGDGGATTSTNELPVFTNTAIPGSFSIQKHTTNSTGSTPDPNQEFTYTVKITYPDGQDIPETLDYTLSKADDASASTQSASSAKKKTAAKKKAKAAATKEESQSDQTSAESATDQTVQSTQDNDSAQTSEDTQADDSAQAAEDTQASDVNSESESDVSDDAAQTSSEQQSVSSTASTESSPVVSFFSALARKASALFSAPSASNGISLMSATPAGTGTAYAVLDSSGNLTFIRSNSTIANGTDGTITDCEGNTYTGTIYTGFEDNAYSSTSMVPWFSNRSAIASVTFKDEIKPTSTAYWFAYCTNMTSCDLANLDTSDATGMNYMFYNCSKLTSLDVSGFDTSNVTDMKNMFYYCSKLTSLDVSGWNTSNVTDMNDMFYNCSGLTSLDVSGFDTSNVTDMGYMFYNCSKLTSLDVSGWNTSNVTDMSSMFLSCSALTSLDVSGFDTSNVTSMRYLFRNCSKLTSLDLSGWNTSNVTDMYCMFNGCSALTSLDVSGWNTSSVTDMSYMFQNCYKLASLDLSSWNTSNVTKMYNMFYRCSSLTLLDLSSFDTSNVTSMSNMFSGCSSLASLDLSSFDTSKVESMYNMFNSCRALTSLDVSSFDTSNVTNMSSMFQGCSGLASLDVSGFDTSNVTGMNGTFSGCSGLTSLDVSKFDTSKVTSMGSMFSGCSGLDSLDLSSFDTSNVTGMNEMFRGCSSLTSLDLSGFDTSNVMNMDYMFYDCDTLASLDMSGWDTSKVTKMEYMFWYCSALEEVDLSNWDNTALRNGSAFNGNTSLSKVTLGSKTDIEKLEMPDVSSDTTRYTGKWELQGTSTALTSSEIEAQFPGTDNSLVGTWVWQRVSYPITFDKNSDDASGSMAQQTYQGDPLTLSTNTFYRLGYDFAGWNTAADGSGTSYADGATIDSLDSAMTLYAQWEEIDTTVTVTDGEFTLTLKAGEKATFDNLPAGATYEVVESSAPGWTVESQTGTSGTIESESTQAASFTNAYTPGQTSASLSASKTLDNAAPADGLFSFTLQPSGDNAATEPMPTGTTGEGTDRTLTVQNAATGVSFGSMTYTTAGTYTYTIKETVPSGATDNGDGTFTKDGVTYIYYQNVETATVTVSDDGQGNLTATVAYDDDGATFSNTTVPGSLTISKTIEGVTSSDKTFDFTVTLLKDAAVLTDAYTYTVKNADGTDGTGGTVTSGGTISLSGGQTATITGLPAGTAYTVTESDLDGGWTQTASSGNTGTIASNGTSEASFTNTYSASGSATIKGEKALYRPSSSDYSTNYEAGDFQFALYNADADGNATGDPIQTVSNGSPDADETSSDYGISTVEFLPITYTLDDMSDATDNGDGTRTKEFTYVVKEVIPDGATYDEGRSAYTYDGIQYDDSSQIVTVTVTDDGSGTLTTSVSDDTFPFFSNQIEDGTAWLTKTVGTPSPAKSNQEFPFTVTLSASGEYNYEIWAPDDGEDGTLTGAGTISNGGATVVTYDASGNAITTDHIDLKDGETLYIRNLPVGSTYAFEEQTPSGWTQKSSSNMSGTVTADEYESEDDSSDSNNLISAFATIVDPKVPTTPKATVTNDYSASGSASFSATKTLTGATLQDDQFAFELVDSSGNVVSRATNDASGNIDFGTISYTLDDLANSDGTYAKSKDFTYTVREVHGGTTLGDVTYDGTTYQAKVTVTDNGNGTLSTSVAYLNADGTAVDKATFANVDNPKGTAVLQANKDLVDADNNALSDWGGRTYTFTVTPNDGAPMRTSATGDKLTSLTSSAASQTSPTAAFTQFVYTYDDLKNADGTYAESKEFTYAISETVPDDATTTVTTLGNTETKKYSELKDSAGFDATNYTWTLNGVTYTTATHTATVTVSNSGNGVLDTSVVYDKGTDSESTTPPTLTNSYTPTPTTGTILVTKSLSGRDWTDNDSFSFVLTAVDGAPLRTADGDQDSLTATATRGTATDGYAARTPSFPQLTFTYDDLAVRDSSSNVTGYDQEREFTYNIHEQCLVDGEDKNPTTGGFTKDGVTYAADQTVTIKVTDNGAGALVVTYKTSSGEWGNTATPATFENAYTTGTATAQILVGKSITGRSAWNDGESYTFQLTAGTNTAGDGVTTPMPDPSTVTVNDSSNVTATLADGTQKTLEHGAAFGEITYEKAGTYLYTVTEVIPDDATTTVNGETKTYSELKDTENFNASSYVWSKNGVTYSTASHSAKVVVSDDGKGNLSAKVYYRGDYVQPIVFSNSYTAENTKASVEATKTVNGTTLEQGTYSIQVIDNNDTHNGMEYSGGTLSKGTVVGSVGMTAANKGHAKAELSSITFTAAGEYHFIMREAIPDDATNASVNEGNTKYKDAGDNQSTSGWIYQGVTYDASQVAVTVTVSDNGYGQLQASVDYDGDSSTAPTFSNAYGASGVAQVSATKALTGRDLTAGEFGFELYEGSDADGEPLRTASNEADGTVTFAPLTYTLEDLDGAASKIFDYTISEQLPEDDDPDTKGVQHAGVTYDGSTHVVHVKVSDGGKGKITTEVTYDNNSEKAPTFTNSYKATGTATMSAVKTLNGNAPKAGRFSFQLYEGDPDQGGKLLQTVSNGEGGTVSFDPISYRYDPASKVDDTGDYVYTIREVAPEGATINSDDTRTYDGMTYDADKTVRVSVSDAGDGTLNVAYDGKEDLTPPSFANTYSATPTKVRLSAHKMLKGGKLANKQFNFELKGSDGTTITLTNNANGTIALPKWTYNKSGTWTYTLSEIDDGAPGYTYDSTVYTITVTVVDDGKGALDAVVSVNNGSKKVDADDISFKNVYDSNAEVTDSSKSSDGMFSVIFSGSGVPHTGDLIANIAILLVVLMVIAGVVVFLVHRRRKKGDKKDRS
jgi:pilin isopeptide linkage protein/uncharacterized repeat protein (TIGR02543 family)